MIQFKLNNHKTEHMKYTFSVIFMIAILATMTIVAAIDIMPEAEAFKKSKGVYNPKYGSQTKGIVCGDKLCSEITEAASSGMSITKLKTSPTMQMSSGIVSVDSVVGATVKDTQLNRQSGTITVSIDAYDDGKITLNLSSSLKDAFMVIVDGEEWDDAHIDGNNVKVYFYAGTEKIEIIGNV